LMYWRPTYRCNRVSSARRRKQRGSGGYRGEEEGLSLEKAALLVVATDHGLSLR
jgi:hypothetical protein